MRVGRERRCRAAPTPARLPAARTIAATAEDAADSLYRLGRQAINDDNYERAVSIFRQVVDKYPKSTSAGDALYWRAWAAYQLGRDRHNKDYFESALDAIELLQQNYPKATSIADARDLRHQHSFRPSESRQLASRRRDRARSEAGRAVDVVLGRR